MDRPNTIQILLTNHDIDYRKAHRLKPPSGRVIVEMLPESEKIGHILLPETVAGKFRPDVGIVLAVGPDVNLAPGSTVCVRGYDGQWIEDYDAGYVTKNQIRMYGAAAAFRGEIMSIPWAESIPLQVVFEGDDPDLVATNRNVIIRRAPRVTEETSGDFTLILPDQSHYFTGKATILSIGPDVDLLTEDGPLKVGDQITYNSRGELDFAFGADPLIAIIDCTAINCVVAPEVAA